MIFILARKPRTAHIKMNKDDTIKEIQRIWLSWSSSWPSEV